MTPLARHLLTLKHALADRGSKSAQIRLLGGVQGFRFRVAKVLRRKAPIIVHFRMAVVPVTTTAVAAAAGAAVVAPAGATSPPTRTATSVTTAAVAPATSCRSLMLPRWSDMLASGLRVAAAHSTAHE